MIDIGLVVLQVPAIHNLFTGMKIVDNKNSLAKNVSAIFTEHDNKLQKIR